MNFDTFVLGALLHDIGKFVQRKVGKNLDKEAKAELRCNYPGVNVSGYIHALWNEPFFKDNPHLFSEPSEVFKLALYHHSDKKSDYQQSKYDKLIHSADVMSSSERSTIPEEYDTETPGLPRSRTTTPLLSVFAQVELTQQRRFKGDRYDLAPLSVRDHSTFPQEELPGLDGAYERLKGQMEELADQNTWKLRDLNFKDDIVTLYHILYKYMWCMPSATPSGLVPYYPDISLLDHSTTSAAIASCLYRLGEGKQPNRRGRFVLLKGDVSGIQNFIYGIAQPQSVKGVSKRLRGRSFHVIAIAEAAARYILRAANLKIVNLLRCGGGEFEILLPNEESVMQRVDEAIKKIECDMFQWLHGELGITFAKHYFSGSQLTKDFGAILDKINDGMSHAKGEKFRGAIADLGMQAFILPDEERPEKPTYCRACMVQLTERNRLDEEASVCKLCEHQKDVGGFLPKSKFIIFTDVEKDRLKACGEVKPVQIPGGWGSVWLAEKQEDVRQFLECNADEKGSAEVYKINEPEGFILDLQKMKEKPLRVSYGFWFLADSVPLAEAEFPHADARDPDNEEERYKKGDVLDFSDIAALSIGDNRLGILRMDVDRAGLIFSIGLDRGEGKTDKSISRIATMSRMLHIFFCGVLNQICESVSREWWEKVEKEANATFNKYNGKIERDNIFYTVYAGGDDLFIVGPWSEIPHLAQRISEEFRHFTSANPNITISGGAFFCKPKFPINRFAQLTHDQLARSKERGGDRMTIFGESALWSGSDAEADMDRLIGLGQDLYRAATAENPDDRLARAFLHGLIRMRQQFVRGDDVDPNFIPALIYQITRNVSAQANIKVNDKDEKLWTYLKGRLVSSADGWPTFEKITIPASYALLKLRERR